MEYDYLLCGDCLELMKGLQDESIDLTITSPPYDNLRTYNGYTWDFEGIARELYRVTKDGGVVVWIVNDATIKGSETGSSFRQALFFKECGFNLHDTMIWVKTGGGSCGSHYTYTQNTEYMFVLSKGKPKSINLIRDNRNKQAGKIRKMFYERPKRNGERVRNARTVINPQFSKRSNWWMAGRGNGYKGHPATFPEKLVRDHIITWSNEGNVVFDPFVGSGTTAVAALKSGRHYIGFDISKEYCDMATERIREYKEGQKNDRQ